MALRMPPPKMSLRVLFESLGHPEYFKYFREAGLTMVDANAHWSDVDVDDIILAVEKRRSDQKEFTTQERVFLWKSLRYMWSRGPNHNCKFLQPSEVQPMFLPKRDWRQMDSDVKFASLDPDRQRQVLRKPQLLRGQQAWKEVQFEVYRRQHDIFYEVKDIENSVAAWMRSDPRKMMREDPREEAMKLRIRTIMDAVAGLLHVRKVQQTSRHRWNIFFFLCRLVLIALSATMYITGYARYSGAPTMGLALQFWTSSGQFVSGTAFMLAFWFAFLVADRAKEDRQHKRFSRVLLTCERLSEDISSFRVESYDYRMEKHEAAAQMVSAQITHDQVRSQKTDPSSSKPKRRRKKKHVDNDLAGWAPDTKLDNMDEWRLQLQKDIENSFRKLEALPSDFRQNGGDRMERLALSNAVQHRSLRTTKLEDRFLPIRNPITDHAEIPAVELTFDADLAHVKAPMQLSRREPQPTHIAMQPLPQLPPLLPPMDRPSFPPPSNLPPLPSDFGIMESERGSTPAPSTPPFSSPPYSRSSTALNDATPLWVSHAQRHNISVAQTLEPSTPQSPVSSGSRTASRSFLRQGSDALRFGTTATSQYASLREAGGSHSPHSRPGDQPHTQSDSLRKSRSRGSDSANSEGPEKPDTQLDSLERPDLSRIDTNPLREAGLASSSEDIDGPGLDPSSPPLPGHPSELPP